MKLESKYDLGALVEFNPNTIESEQKNGTKLGYIRSIKFQEDKKAIYEIEVSNSKDFLNSIKEEDIVQFFRPQK